MLVCVFYMHFARETAGAARTRLSLRPLLPGGGRMTQTSGASHRGNVDAYERGLISRRHCEERKRRSNPAFFFSAPCRGCLKIEFGICEGLMQSRYAGGSAQAMPITFTGSY